MGAGIGLFLGWENGIGVTRVGIWPLGMGNEVLKNGNGIEIMPVDFQFFALLKCNIDVYDCSKSKITLDP